MTSTSLTDREDDIDIRGQRSGFATLEQAQAAGDLQASRDRDRRAGRVLFDYLRKVTA